jgi:predicted nucleotidyltransferase
LRPSTIPPERPVDPLTVEVLRTVIGCADRLGIPIFVAGAMARDIVLYHVHGFDRERATSDLDFAVMVSDWSQFDRLKASLTDSGWFVESAEQQSLLFDGVYRVDLVPFGEVAGAKSIVAWPPHRHTVMNVMGYEEALEHALQVEVAPGLVVPVCSMASLAALKLFAWLDRRNKTRKDALDFSMLLRRYGETLGDRMYESAVFESVGYDRERAGARLLGKHARAVLRANVTESLLAMLNDARERDNLTVQIAAGLSHFEEPLDIATLWLEEFRLGLAEPSES